MTSISAVQDSVKSSNIEVLGSHLSGKSIREEQQVEWQTQFSERNSHEEEEDTHFLGIEFESSVEGL